MRRIIYTILILLIISFSYGQKVFEYEFDKNISLKVLENTEEGEMPNGKFIKGTFENEFFLCLSSNKLKDKFDVKDEEDLIKLFHGIRDGGLKTTEGKLVNEEIINIKNKKVLNFKISFELEGLNKLIESYVFVHNNIIYTVQFMNNEKEFEKLESFRKDILDSVKFN